MQAERGRSRCVPVAWERALDRSHVASAQSRGPSPIVRTCLSGAAPRPRSPPWVRCQQPSQWGPGFDQVLRPGAVVATHCEALEAGSAAIIVHVASENDTLFPSTASVLELDWSGSTRPTIDDVGSAAPLRLTHHDHTGRLSYCRHEAKLPRNYEVIGELPVPELERSNSFTPRWTVGQQLARQRRWGRRALRGRTGCPMHRRRVRGDGLAQGSVRLDPALRDETIKRADADGVTVSEVVRRALCEYLRSA